MPAELSRHKVGPLRFRFYLINATSTLGLPLIKFVDIFANVLLFEVCNFSG